MPMQMRNFQVTNPNTRIVAGVTKRGDRWEVSMAAPLGSLSGTFTLPQELSPEEVVARTERMMDEYHRLKLAVNCVMEQWNEARVRIMEQGK